MELRANVLKRPHAGLSRPQSPSRSFSSAQSRVRFPAGVPARALIAPIGYLATAPDAVFRRNVETKADLPLMGQLSQETTEDVLLCSSFVQIGAACPDPLSLVYQSCFRPSSRHEYPTVRPWMTFHRPNHETLAIPELLTPTHARVRRASIYPKAFEIRNANSPGAAR